MNKRIGMKVAATCYLINIIYMFGAGLAFVFASEFFPFHSDVIRTPWEEVDGLSQILYLGMMRTEGAGFLASAVAMSFLLVIPFREQKQWSYWAIAIIGLVEHAPTLIATYHVSNITNASPPWQVTLAAMILLIIGLLAAISTKRHL